MTVTQAIQAEQHDLGSGRFDLLSAVSPAPDLLVLLYTHRSQPIEDLGRAVTRRIVVYQDRQRIMGHILDSYWEAE